VSSTIARNQLGDVFAGIKATEITPPLYFYASWMWGQLFGVDEVGLRSLSALAGVATVPAVWAAGRRLVSPGAGLLAAALVAVNPMLVWYSQEARSYALLVLFTSWGFYFWVRARETPSWPSLAGWAALSAAALATHYFAVFVLLPEAALLLVRASPNARRAAALPCIPVVLAGLALVPLARLQDSDRQATWISNTRIGERVDHVVRELATANVSFVSSSSPRPGGPLGLVGLGLVAAGVALVCTRTLPRERRGAALAAGVGGVAIAVPLVMAGTPLDYFKDRNLLPAWTPLLVALAAGFAVTRPRGLALGAGVALCAASLAVDLRIAADDDLQRTDWRAMTRALGPRNEARAVVIEPSYAKAPLEVYGRRVTRNATGVRVQEIDFIGQLKVPEPAPGTGPFGFRLVAERRVGDIRLLRYRSGRPLELTPTLIAQSPVPFYIELSSRGETWANDATRLATRWQADAAALARSRRARLRRRPDDGRTLARLHSVPPELANGSRLLARLEAVAAARVALLGPSPEEAPRQDAFRRAVAALGRS
jgi:mannosyltransferase